MLYLLLGELINRPVLLLTLFHLLHNILNFHTRGSQYCMPDVSVTILIFDLISGEGCYFMQSLLLPPFQPLM